MKRLRFLIVSLCFSLFLCTACGPKEQAPEFTGLSVETYSFIPELQWGMFPEQAASALGKSGLTLNDLSLSAACFPASDEDPATTARICAAILTLNNTEFFGHSANIALYFANPSPPVGFFYSHPEEDPSMGLVSYQVTFPITEGKNYIPLMDAVEEQGVKIGNGVRNPAGTTLADLPDPELAEQTKIFLESWTNVAPIDSRQPDVPFDLSTITADFNSGHSKLTVQCQGLFAATALYIDRIQGYMEEQNSAVISCEPVF